MNTQDIQDRSYLQNTNPAPHQQPPPPDTVQRPSRHPGGLLTHLSSDVQAAARNGSTPRMLQGQFSATAPQRQQPATAAQDSAVSLTDEEAMRFAAGINDSLIQAEKAIVDASTAGLQDDEVLLHNQILGEVGSVVNAALEGSAMPAAASLSAPTRDIAIDIHESLERAREQTADGRLTPAQRQQAILDALGRTVQEGMGDKARRWGGNLAWLAARTGVIVATLTTLRQAAGFAMEQQLMENRSSAFGRACLGTAISLIGPALNMAGALRDEVRHSATGDSRTARLQMLGASLAGIAATQLSGTQAIVPSFLLQATLYTVTRDAIQAFFPLQSNIEGLNAAAVAAAQTAYGINQFAVSEAMNRLTPDSGAGAAMSAPGTRTNWPQNLGRGVLNAATEVLDDATLHGVTRTIQAANNKEAIRVQSPEVLQRLASALDQAEQQGLQKGLNGAALDDHVRTAARQAVQDMTEGLKVWVEARIPTVRQLLDQMLTTNAMRTSAFNATYAIALAADAAIGNNVPPATKSLLVNMLVGGLLSYIYGPFVNAYRQNPVPAAKAPSAESSSSSDLSTAGSDEGLRRRAVQYRSSSEESQGLIPPAAR